MNESTLLEEKLRQLVELRKQEEAEYGKLLTRLDEICRFHLPDEAESRFPEIKDTLNRIWDISNGAFSSAQSEDRNFWKDVAQSFVHYVEPLVSRQRDVNSAIVHLLNEYVSSVQTSLKEIQDFHSTLILYFQHIIPVIDTKFREMVGSAESFQVGLRDYIDLLYQELDKKIQTLQLDVQKLKELQAPVSDDSSKE